VISHEARRSFDRILQHAARSRLPVGGGDCTITALNDDAALHDAHTRVALLTISSMAFRLLLILHFTEDDAMRAYYLGEQRERALQEAFLEVCNLCCGAINQALQNHFPDLGMSTPYVLDARCVPHLSELDPAYLAAYEIQLGEAVRMGATICVCANAAIDFVADIAAAEESSGELELF
jgi:hypothetical protein